MKIEGTWTEKEYLNEIVTLRDENERLKKENKQLIARLGISENERFYGEKND